MIENDGEHIYAQQDGDGASLVKRIESRNGLHTWKHAKEIGLGSRAYELVLIQRKGRKNDRQ